MVQLAAIVPPKIIPKVAHALGTYNFVIATKHPVEVVRDYLYGTVIVDNGAYEDEAAMGAEQLAEYVLEISGGGRTVVAVVPDVMADAAATLRLAERSIPVLRQTGAVLMGVAQGRTLPEVVETGRELLQMGCDILGAPKHLRARLGTRVVVVEKLTELAPVHVLGFSDILSDDLASVRWPGVLGIDSATPVWAALTGAYIHFNKESGHRPLNFWEMEVEDAEPVVGAIRQYRRLVQGVPGWKDRPANR